MSWTPEREEKLKELWKKGHTASKIAELIGNTTRNAIIGKAHRLNLQARAISKKSTPKINLENKNTLFLELQEFAESCINKKNYRIKNSEAAHNVKVMEAIVKSSKINKKIFLS